MKKIIIGVDVSAKTLDICIKDENKLSNLKIDNTIVGIRTFLKKYDKEMFSVYLAMENTGRYNWNLYEVLEKFKFVVFVINPLHLKKSLGLTRGKNDIIDAERICLFAEKNHLELPVWKASSDAVKKIKIFHRERSSRVKMRTNLMRQQQDYSLMKPIKLDKELMKLNQNLIKGIEKQIHIIECKIQAIINEEITLKEQAQRIQTIPGVGKVLTWMIIAKTEGFTAFTDPRKMACYAGVVTFDHQSGTSVKYKSKVSMYADKELKSILHLAAMSAIRLDNELRTYYLRKVEQGKNKMSVLNAVRNKIIHRIFALVKNENSYQKDFVLS